MVWDWIIASYLFLAGLGAGAFALAALVGFVKPDAVKLRTIGYVVAPVAVAIGTVLLMVDAKAGLQNPLRFFALLTNFSSIMTWGVVILIAFMVVSIVALVVMVRTKKTPRALDIIGLACAVAVAMYTGLLLGDAPGFPLWNPFVLPLLFLVSAASSGFAAVLAIARAMKSAELASIGFLKKTGIAFPVLEALLIAVLLAAVNATGGSGQDAAAASVANLVSGSFAGAFWLGLVIIGLVLPFCMELLHLRGGKKAVSADASADAAASVGTVSSAASTGNGAALAGEVGVLVGGFLLRYLIIMAAIPVTLY